MHTISNVIRLAITFTPIIIYTAICHSINIQSFHCTYNTITYIHGIYMAHFHLLLSAPCCCPLAPLCVPLCIPLSTYLAPSSCDRNCPPSSQVACKLTPFAPPFTQLPHPSQIPRTPPALRLTTTTSGIFRLLLSGTVVSYTTTESCAVYCIPEKFSALYPTTPLVFFRCIPQ